MPGQSRGPGRKFKKGEGGRPKGVPNKATREIKEVARGLLEAPEYLAALKRRLAKGTAGPVEVTLYHYGYGKPKETVAHEGLPPLLIIDELGDDD